MIIPFRKTRWAVRFTKQSPLIASFILLDGCSFRGAPSFALFGAYFPGWMLCGLIGILTTIGVRILFVATDLANDLPYGLFVCTSIGLIVALLVWLLWFGL